uniref:hypothetical protein n=1 Tax=Halosiphon tomentosus TaxID=64927 RepID=UPI002E7631C1|nr:hypothetical protein V2488_pgp064 [Halosiphon tomentosus]WAM63757.1 hypothetical protein [Halosiphon tomentosus]
MCICLNCNRVDNCLIVFFVEQKHKEKGTIIKKASFFPQSPILLCINLFSKKNSYSFEWDVNECLSYQEEAGAWLLSCSKILKSSSYLSFDLLF